MPPSKGALRILAGWDIDKFAAGRPLKGPRHSFTVKLDLEGDTRLATNSGASCPLQGALVSGPVQESTFNGALR